MSVSSLSSHPGPDPTIPQDWPDRAHSRLSTVGGIRWHWQLQGEGPLLLLVHGTGGSAHSWGPCVPALARHYTVLRLDLPGHGFSVVRHPSEVPADPRDDPWALEGMAAAVAGVLDTIGARPQLVAGHSAGVPLLLHLVRTGALTPARLVGICPALVPPHPLLTATLGGVLGGVVGAVATAPATARGVARLARDTALVRALLASTGSAVTPPQVAHYATLCADPRRVRAALAMMARWALPAVLRDAHALRVPVALLAGTRDRWVPLPALRRAVDRYLPQASLATAPGGHLLPEEDPARVVACIRGG